MHMLFCLPFERYCTTAATCYLLPTQRTADINTNTPMYQCPMYQCTNVPMDQCTNVPMYHRQAMPLSCELRAKRVKCAKQVLHKMHKSHMPHAQGNGCHHLNGRSISMSAFVVAFAFAVAAAAVVAVVVAFRQIRCAADDFPVVGILLRPRRRHRRANAGDDVVFHCADSSDGASAAAASQAPVAVSGHKHVACLAFLFLVLVLVYVYVCVCSCMSIFKSE